MKKMLALVAALTMIVMMFAAPMSANAVTFTEDKMKIMPGTTQSEHPVYSRAWIDKLVIRDDATAVVASKVTPKPEYPYDKTFEEFVSDANDYALITELNEETVNSAFDSTMKALFYVATALGMTGDIDTMYSFVSDKGIRVPSNLGTNEKMQLSVVYAAIKYDAIYVLYDKKVDFTKGMTVDEASAVILSELGGFKIPSEVKSVSGLSKYFIKDYVEQNSNVPLSSNPDEEELFYWTRAITASEKGYAVPLVMYGETTQAQRDYVDYAYYATCLDTLYDITLNPFALASADSKGDTYAIPTLILQTMLEEKNVDFDKNAKCENLFKKACENGCFDLDQEFYSDIYNYDITVNRDCEKLWFTPFALADQIDGENKYVSINLQGQNMTPAATKYAKLSPNKDTEKVKLQVTYDDHQNKPEKATYVFNVIKSDEKTDADKNDITSQVGNAIGSAIPSDNEKVNNILTSVQDQVNGAISNAVSGAQQITAEANLNKNIISTYAVDETTAEGHSEPVTNELYNFSYLDGLIESTYNVNGYAGLDLNKDTTEKDSIVAKTIETIKEKPEIVAAPTSLVTFAGIAGLLFTRKNKKANSLAAENKTEED